MESRRGQRGVWQPGLGTQAGVVETDRAVLESVTAAAASAAVAVSSVSGMNTGWSPGLPVIGGGIERSGAEVGAVRGACTAGGAGTG